MTEIIALRGQMQAVSNTATCSLEFINSTNNVQLWWIDGEKAYTATLSIYSLDIRNKKFHQAIREAKKVMR